MLDHAHHSWYQEHSEEKKKSKLDFIKSKNFCSTGYLTQRGEKTFMEMFIAALLITAKS